MEKKIKYKLFTVENLSEKRDKISCMNMVEMETFKSRLFKNLSAIISAERH